MPVLILAAMTVKAWEDPDTDLERPTALVAWLMIATLAFALVPVNDGESWSLGVAENPEQYLAVLAFGLAGAGPLPRHCPLSGGPEDLLPPDAGGGAGFQLCVRHRAHRHRQIWPVELRQRPGGTVPGVHRPAGPLPRRGPGGSTPTTPTTTWACG